ncbi:hypothetical protein [Plantactinospora sp. KBS50]|uniref:hypothetical protein n=1 Tax=Plantactinospora sp. KBS50 TaxID=2024580 RepID=UPI001E295B0F|nr:hypothetical protein [Plantactinospora sp. KBS50]
MFSTSRLFAATYPEAIKIAALVGSLHWRRQAAGDPDGQRRFAAEICRRLGQPDYRPKVSKDSIAHWIDDDCWRPPTLPPTTYRTLPGFGNPTISNPTSTASTATTAAHAGSPATAAADASSSTTATSAPSSPATGHAKWNSSSAPSKPAPKFRPLTTSTARSRTSPPSPTTSDPEL